MPIAQATSPQPRPDSNHQRTSSFFLFRRGHAHTPSESTFQFAPSPQPQAQLPQNVIPPPVQAPIQSNIPKNYTNQPLPEPPAQLPQQPQVQGPGSIPLQLQTAPQLTSQHKQHPQQQQQAPAQPQQNAGAAGQQAINVPQSPTNQSQQPQLHAEIRSVLHLTMAHAQKIYYSGPLVRRIERQADGQKPTKDDGWTDVWAQLGGTTLSIWDMKQVQEASKQGREVPPTYVNMTDAFIQVLGSVTVPSTPTSPAKRYTNVLTINTAGSNLLLFSCPSPAALMSWAAAFRLSSWEKSRLEEIYTAHLIRITLRTRDIPSTLVRGRMEGWVRIRIAGQTDWKRVWMVVLAASGEPTGQTDRSSVDGGIGSSPTPSATLPKKRRMSSLFTRDHSPTSAAGPVKSMIGVYMSQKGKDKKKALLTMYDVTQAFAVYPERPELISRSTLLKIEGQFGTEELAGSMRLREGWLLIMPDLEGGHSQAGEMLKWVIAIHDAFGLYGRPGAWTWDPRNEVSMMFGYPVGQNKDHLFLEREVAESLDPRDDRTSAIRLGFQKLLRDRMQNMEIRTVAQPQPQQPQAQQQQQLLQIQSQQTQQPDAAPGLGPQLPPLSFGELNLHERSQLSPVTERSGLNTPNRAGSGDAANTLSTVQFPQNVASSVPEGPHIMEASSPQPTASTSSSHGQLHSEPQSVSTVLDDLVMKSPQIPSSSTSFERKRSDDIGIHSLSSFDRSQPLSTATSQSTSDDRPRSRTSILTSPHSIPDKRGIGETIPGSPRLAPSDKSSVLISPYSPVTARREQVPTSPSMYLQAPAPKDLSPSSTTDIGNTSNLINELTTQHQQRAELPSPSNSVKQPQASRRVPTTISEQDDSSTSESTRLGTLISGSALSTSPKSISKAPENVKPVVRPIQNTTVPVPGVGGIVERSGNGVPTDRLSPNVRAGLGRKPSGAREQGTGRPYNNEGFSATQTLTEEDSDTGDSMDHPTSQSQSNLKKPHILPSGSTEEPNLDVLAALSYLDVNDDHAHSQSTGNTIEPLKIRGSDKGMSSPPQESSSSLVAAPHSPASSEPVTQYKSSFAPSKQAAERKAKAQAQQAAHHAAVHKPGRLNGKRKSKIAGAWNESSDEDEEDEEEDEDDEADSDDGRPASNKQATSSGPASSTASIRPPQIQSHSSHLSESNMDINAQSRPPRTLPQLPGNRLHGEEYHMPQPRRMLADQYPDAGRRTYHEDGPQIRSQAEHPAANQAQKSLWSQVLDPGRTPGQLPESHNRDTFIQLEPPSETMTKAFTPQGLLSAGLQDKQDRSAKRQEELARETGASLINVPNKPPPPQTGLLGAITAHERERKREGGVGAALTEREREKRLAEERQRRFDEQQRQQLEQMQQTGSMYGQFPPFNPMMNPMMMGMMNPMMTGGMAPMMTGGMAPMMTGYHNMMGGLNPQHILAAQQAAAQAYQHAMMAFSTAGSQVGGENGMPSQPLAPNMTGNMGGMGGFDPRMSMMGMGMMNPQMGMPLGMQMTGMSTFDPRFSMNGGNAGPTGVMADMGLQPPGVLGGQNSGSFASRNSSPAGRDSPARPSDLQEAPRGSRPATPKS
ncbi:hypothetical protein AMATHDRAFT_172403 [Amanita thiersii Skay4041]|uniref:PH domain-containing protein n=1 Tax=Amanita thiersii Skay4041 TaxID=703135 RepID=A0A2A9NPL2_9AGAR|nr:hypothetical protein AMATHDRAFT_172403 [Amanita thiersii Skay4041]